MYAPKELAPGLVGAATLASSVPSMSRYSVQALCRVSPFPQALGGEWWLLFTALISTLAHKGKSQALLSAPQDVRPLNCLQLQTAWALNPGFR